MTQIQIRRGSSTEWTTVNPVLAEGEWGMETDTLKVKIGNGSTVWTSLAYMSVGWAQITGKPAVIAAGATAADARSAISAASLDANGKVPVSELPNSIMAYQGTWNASTNSPTLADGTGDPGDVYRVSVAGSQNLGSGSISFGVGDYVIYSPATSAWEKADTTDAVATVNGYTGNITLTKSDVGLGSVDNTADANKDVLSATKWTTARNLAGNSVNGTADVAFANKFVVQGTTDAGLSGAQFLGALGTGIVKNTTTTGELSIAAAGTDYAPATSGTAILKGSGGGGFANATAGTDYVAPGGALGTPSSGTLTNCTGLTVSGISATGTRDSTTYLRGDGTWAATSGGISTGKAIAMAMVFG